MAKRPLEPLHRSTASLTYELCPCGWLREEEIVKYLEEFNDAGETCNVLWQLEDITASQWKETIEVDKSTEYVAFIVDNRLVGIGRITHKPKHEANGMIGYAIRPKERGKRYATVFVQMIEETCRKMGMERITACVDRMNIISLHVFIKAGWVPTGREYDWKPDPEPRVAIEMAPTWSK